MSYSLGICKQPVCQRLGPAVLDLQRCGKSIHNTRRQSSEGERFANYTRIATNC